MQLSMVCPTSPHTGMYWGIGGGWKVISSNFTPGLGEFVILAYTDVYRLRIRMCVDQHWTRTRVFPGKVAGKV